MRCPRCNGNLHAEDYVEDGERVRDVRCIQCAERFYPSQILMDRQRVAMGRHIDRKLERPIQPYHISCFKR